MFEVVQDRAQHSTKPTASLQAHFNVVRGQTQMSRCYATAPLKIAKTFPNEAGLDVCLMDASPGLLAGDRYELSWHLETGAQAFITTQGFTRVHPSVSNPCFLRQEIYVEEGALLEFFPEPLMLYRDAALRNESVVDISAGGTLVIAEVICAGRVGKGEEFLFHSLVNRQRVRCGGELIFINHTGHYPPLFEPGRVGAWLNFTHIGSFGVFTSKLDKTAFETMRDEIRALLEDDTVNTGQNRVWGGVSLLDRHGLVINLMGHRAHDLQELNRGLRLKVRSYLEQY